MEWKPEEQAWLTYIKFEMRYKEVDEARNIYEQFILVHPEVRNTVFSVPSRERFLIIYPE